MFVNSSTGIDRHEQGCGPTRAVERWMRIKTLALYEVSENLPIDGRLSEEGCDLMCFRQRTVVGDQVRIALGVVFYRGMPAPDFVDRGIDQQFEKE